eukprot:10168454-Lingulodinium_polyedra.AAC.1
MQRNGAQRRLLVVERDPWSGTSTSRPALLRLGSACTKGHAEARCEQGQPRGRERLRAGIRT